MVSSKQLQLERRPRLLKDFLGDDSNSCSSSGFKSFPRKCPINQDPCIGKLIEIDVNSRKYGLQRSRSKATAATISAFQAVINAVKHIHLTKSPSILPRSFSRKLSRRNSNRDGGKEGNGVKIGAVTVKDIMRWKSFRDLAEEEKENAPPVDFASTATTTTGSTTTTPCSSNRSSWCESDFTSEYFPEERGEKFLPGVGKDSTETTTVAAESAVGPEDEWNYEDEEEQHSPVSVLGFQDEDEEAISSFNKSLENMERTKQKLMQKIQQFEYLGKMDHASLEEWMSSSSSESKEEEENNDDEEEEKAKKLLYNVREFRSLGSSMDDELLLDFFKEELNRNKKHGRSSEDEMVRVAKAWMNRDKRMIVGWEKEKRGIFVSDMDREGWRSSKFEEEKEELASEVESAIINHLMDEILVDDDDLFLW